MLLGVQILWSDDWTWGGCKAYLIAFLWGAGSTNSATAASQD